jgi:hypothetical protein
MDERLRAPFPYYGGKSRVADEVWRRFGDVPNYVEPFCGSSAVLLARPDDHAWWERIETINDADGLVANVWRAIQHDPDGVARYADWPVNEADLMARHLWLVGQREPLTERLMVDPDWYDVKAAGWWIWGMSSWIGNDWCTGNGAWSVEDGRLVRHTLPRGRPRRVASAPRVAGVDRRRPHLGPPMGVHRKPPDLDNAVCARTRAALTDWMRRLSDRLRRVRVVCGDWTRVVGPSVTTTLGVTAVFLDPPYPRPERFSAIYRIEGDVANAVRDWAVAHGDNPRLRIALCGLSGTYEMPPSWTVYRWRGAGGYAKAAAEPNLNRFRETIWFSPHCLND